MNFFIKGETSPIDLKLSQRIYLDYLYRLRRIRYTDQTLCTYQSSLFCSTIAEIKKLYKNITKVKTGGATLEYRSLDYFLEITETQRISFSNLPGFDEINYEIVEKEHQDNIIFEDQNSFDKFFRSLSSIPMHISISSLTAEKISYLPYDRLLKVYNAYTEENIRGNAELTDKEYEKIINTLLYHIPNNFYYGEEVSSSIRIQVSPSKFMTKFIADDGISSTTLQNLWQQNIAQLDVKKHIDNFFIYTKECDIARHYNQQSYCGYESCSDCEDDYDNCTCESTPGTLGDSCMRYDSCRDFFKIYSTPGASLAVLKDEQGDVVARCVLWDNVKIIDSSTHKLLNTINCFDRIYYSYPKYENILTAILISKGYASIRGRANIVALFELKDKDITRYPYLDTMHYKNKNYLISSSKEFYSRNLSNYNGYTYSVFNGKNIFLPENYDKYIKSNKLGICNITGALLPKSMLCTLYTGQVVNKALADKVIIPQESSAFNTASGVMDYDKNIISYALAGKTHKCFDGKSYLIDDVKRASVNDELVYVPNWYINDDEEDIITLNNKTFKIVGIDRYKVQKVALEENSKDSILYSEYKPSNFGIKYIFNI